MDIKSGKTLQLYRGHTAPVTTLAFCDQVPKSGDGKILITGSWDRTLRFWDPRASSPQQSSHSLPERVYQMDLVNYNLVVSMASRLFHIYDIRKMDAPAQTRESSLKYLTRALACMSDGQGACSQLCSQMMLDVAARLCYCFRRRKNCCRVL